MVRSRLFQVADQLLDEERVAAGLVADDRGQAFVEAAGDQVPHLVRVEGFDLDPRRRQPALKLAEGLRQVALRRQLGVTVDAEREDAPQRVVAGHRGEQAQGRAVGPVQVVEDDQHRPSRRETADHPHHRTEQGLPFRLEVGSRSGRGQVHATGQLRQEPREGRAVTTDDVGRVDVTELTHRRLQQAAPDPEGPDLIGVRPAVEDRDVIPAGRQLGREPRLADPAFAGQQRDPQLAGRGQVQLGLELAEDLVATDQATGLDPGVDFQADLLRGGGRAPSRHGRGGCRPVFLGAGLFVGVQQPFVDGREFGGGKGAELVPEQHPQLLICPQRLGDVALRFKQLDQRGPGRLAKRRSLDRVAGRPFGPRLLGRAEPGPDPGDGLKRFEPELLEIEPVFLDPACLQARQQAALEDPGRLLRVVPAGGQPFGAGLPVTGQVLGRAELLLRHFVVDPGVFAQLERELGPAFEAAFAQRLAQTGERRGEQRLAAAGQALVGPECFDQLVPPDRPGPVQHQVREDQPSLTAR